MYHPGKVIEVFSANKNIKANDKSIQVTLEMWDENVLTFKISNTLGKIVKSGDIVLVDYSPISQKIPLPKHDIVKVLKGESGKKMWKEYKEYLRKMKPAKTTTSEQAQRPNVQYIG